MVARLAVAQEELVQIQPVTPIVNKILVKKMGIHMMETSLIVQLTIIICAINKKELYDGSLIGITSGYSSIGRALSFQVGC